MKFHKSTLPGGGDRNDFAIGIVGYGLQPQWCLQIKFLRTIYYVLPGIKKEPKPWSIGEHKIRRLPFGFKVWSSNWADRGWRIQVAKRTSRISYEDGFWQVQVRTPEHQIEIWRQP
jgi:hypothetical protein